MIRNVRKPLVASAAGVLMLISLCVGAFAFWTNNGTGTASATVGTLTAPGTPGSSSLSSSSVTLQWAGASVTGGGTIDYSLQRRANATGSSWSEVCTAHAASEADGSCTDSTVAPGESYVYRVVGSVATGSWTAASGESSAITIPRVFDHFAISAPDPATAGTPFSVTVTAQDAGNHTVTGYTGTVHFTSSDSQAALPADATFAPADSGAILVDGLTLKTAGRRSLTATDTRDADRTGTTSVEVVPARPSRIAFTTQPTSTTASRAISPAVVAQVQDPFGNVVDSAASVTVALAGGPAGATLSGTKTRGAVAGVARFDDLSVDKAGSGYTLRATSTDLADATSDSFAIAPGAAAKLVFTQQPGGSTGGIALSPQPEVTVQDAAGNPVSSSNAAVTLAIDTNPGSGTLSGARTVNAVDGVATFSGLSIDKAATGYTLAASSSGLAGTTSNAFTVGVGPAAQLAFTQQPSASTIVSSAFAQQPKVAIQDAGGNTVTSSASAVSLALTSGTGTSGAGLTCAANPVNAVSGVATFAGCKVDKPGSGYTLTASSSNLQSATSSSFEITSSAVRFLLAAASTNPVAGVGNALTITAVDSSGNTATTYTGDHLLTFSGASSSPFGNGPTISDKNGSDVPFGSPTTITFSNGVAAAAGTSNGVMKLYKAEAANVLVIDGAVSNSAGPLAVSVNSAPAPISFTTACPTGSWKSSTSWTSGLAIANDAFGNPARYSPAASFTLALSGADAGHWSLSTGAISASSSPTGSFTVTKTDNGAKQAATVTVTGPGGQTATCNVQS